MENNCGHELTPSSGSTCLKWNSYSVQTCLSVLPIHPVGQARNLDTSTYSLSPSPAYLWSPAIFSISITTTLCPHQATIISHLCTGTNSNWPFCSVLTPPFHSPYCTQNDFFFLNTYLILLLPCLKYFSNSPEAESKCLHCIQAL